MLAVASRRLAGCSLVGPENYYLLPTTYYRPTYWYKHSHERLLVDVAGNDGPIGSGVGNGAEPQPAGRGGVLSDGFGTVGEHGRARHQDRLVAVAALFLAGILRQDA